MSDEPRYLEDEHGHRYGETSGGNGWRFAGKVAVAVCAPLVVAFVVNLFVIGRWVGTVNAELASLSEKVATYSFIEERVRLLELEDAARRGREWRGP